MLQQSLNTIGIRKIALAPLLMPNSPKHRRTTDSLPNNRCSSNLINNKRSLEQTLITDTFKPPYHGNPEGNTKRFKSQEYNTNQGPKPKLRDTKRKKSKKIKLKEGIFPKTYD